MSRLFAVLAVSVLVILAGCTGVGLDGVTDESNEPTIETESSGDSTDNGGDTTPVEGELEIHHIDVGQADATLMISPDGETILVDSGDWRQRDSLLPGLGGHG